MVFLSHTGAFIFELTNYVINEANVDQEVCIILTESTGLSESVDIRLQTLVAGSTATGTDHYYYNTCTTVGL